MDVPRRTGALATWTDALLGVWPDHERFLRKSLGDSAFFNAKQAEDVALLLDRLVPDDRAAACRDYRFTCESLLEEEIYFRRSGNYRHTSFAEVEREVYANAPFMARYVRGLLLSHLFWPNHRGMLGFFETAFLAGLAPGTALLEVGPGHGLLLTLAARRGLVLTGWDVSAESLRQTSAALARLGTRAVLEQCDIMVGSREDVRFPAIVLSEILEHLEAPAVALSAMAARLAPNGRMFLNIPVNSPAPDHIHLFRTPEEVWEMVESCGLAICTRAVFPAAGYDEAKARKCGVTMSCVAIAALSEVESYQRP